VRVHSAAEMHDLGVRIAQAAQPGDVIILTGELGAGKTTLAQGVAQGLGITEPVTSPTFVLSKHYFATPTDLIHLDVYRILTADELLDLWSEADAETALTLVEWGAPWIGEFGDSVVELVLKESRSANVREIEIVTHAYSKSDIAERIAGAFT